MMTYFVSRYFACTVYYRHKYRCEMEINKERGIEGFETMEILYQTR